MEEKTILVAQKKHSLSKIDMAKYLLVAAMILFVLFMFLQNRDSGKSFSEVAAAVEASLNEESLQQADDQTLKKYFGLNAADYDGVLLYEATYNMSAEELLLIRVSDDSQLAEVEDAMNQRVEDRKNDFAGYLPEQEKLLEDAVVLTRGSYVLLVVSADSETYQREFRRAL